MSTPHDIDNERALFSFDSFDTRQDEPFEPNQTIGFAVQSFTTTVSLGTSSISRNWTSSMSFNTDKIGDETQGSFTDEDQFSSDERPERVVLGGSSIDKGKGPSRPVGIQWSDLGTTEDIFSMSPLEEGVSFDDRSMSAQSSPTMTASVRIPSSLSGDLSVHDEDPSAADERSAGVFGARRDDDPAAMGIPDRKGKGREVSPTLPPLTFTPGFEYSAINWPTPSSVSTGAGPSSFASSYASNSDPKPQETQRSPAISPPAPIILTRVPSRRRSLSNLSIYSARPLAERSPSGMKLEPAKGMSNLARKLPHKRRGEPDSSTDLGSLYDSRTLDLEALGIVDYGAGNCFMPWKTDSKARPKSGADCIPVPVLSYEAGIAKGLDSRSSARVLRTQGRSYSCPVSPLDIVIPPTLDVFTPIPLPVHRPFDDLLPREVKLHVFKLLVLSHEQEYEKRIADGNWTALKASASRNRWVGKDKGVRELVKFSRVSKSWRSLVFDGQLWSELAVTAFPKLPLPALSRVVSQSGAFMSTIDLTGHTTLSPESLFKLNHSLCISPALPDNQAVTQLKNINLQGCTALTTRSLHDLLIRSPHLENLCLKGLSVVNNTTCELLSTHCRSLVSLNLNRCLNLNAGGLHSLVSGASARGERLRLKELRISGLKYITDTIMAAMGKAMPHLEVLDLSYTRDLHNSALDAFVSLPLEEDDPNSIVLTSREIGRDPGDVTKYRRRVTRLRHLSLSHCLLLTDIACSNLAHCVPRLELFEMAGIGGHLNDEGLIRMLNTTPHIRKIDLEDAMDISDAVLRSLTPVNHSPSQRKSPETPQVGQELEHLVVSYAVNITNEALLGLIRNCPRLRVLEADSTRMTGKTLQEFVRLAHSRRMADAGVVAIDCRGVSESAVTDVSKLTRPRLGWRAHEAKKLAYLDARDDEDLGVGQDECDDKRVVVKTFYSWETVDAVRVARDRKRKTRRALNSSGSSAEDYFSSKSPGRSKWWAPGGRRRSGNNSPSLLDVNNDRDGCTIM